MRFLEIEFDIVNITKDYVTFSKNEVEFFNITKLKSNGINVDGLPYSIRILLENLIRNYDGKNIKEHHIFNLYKNRENREIFEVPFRPTRILLQDFTGIPAVVDLATMREAIKKRGGNPEKINPIIPSDLVIDHSIQVDNFGVENAFTLNIIKEYSRNNERYKLLKWAQASFSNFKVVPPGKGIVHQINLEYLADVIHLDKKVDPFLIYPDSVLGTDSHTTMINGLGVFGWGVGGIEAEASMLGQPYYMSVPKVIGVRLIGFLSEGATATDLVLTITQKLRKENVVGCFVEFFGSGLNHLTIPDRTTISNMAPEYGATMGFFPIDDLTLQYLRNTGREREYVSLIEKYSKITSIFRDHNESKIEYFKIIEIDMREVEPSIAGPKNPEERVSLYNSKANFRDNLNFYLEDKNMNRIDETISKKREVKHGSVVIAAITSCTNTSNPNVMVAAGLLAKKAVMKGLKVKPHIKTSLAPGSTVVTEYLKNSDLMQYLEKLGFGVVGYGCTTCIGNSGPLPNHVSESVEKNGLYVAAVLSGNRNFEARIHPEVRANFLCSPGLVVAYALAGTVDIDLTKDSIGIDKNGKQVYLKDIWPKQHEIDEIINDVVKPEIFIDKYLDIFEGEEQWTKLGVERSSFFSWEDNSTYIRRPNFFEMKNVSYNITNAFTLLVLGDRITTDHISPAGIIGVDSDAGRYLEEKGVDPIQFNTYGSRRGNHEVMIRGTFANIRIRNKMLDNVEGGYTIHVPSNTQTTIYDAAMRYQNDNQSTIIIAGKQYGMGSSRDWAAKGTYLLGVKAVIAESFERIHRNNLIGMGVLPLEFIDGENFDNLNLTGFEMYDILNENSIEPNMEMTMVVKKNSEKIKDFKVITRLDTETEIMYYENGGILQYVLNTL